MLLWRWNGSWTVQFSYPVEGSSVCTITDVFAWPLRYGSPLLRPRPPPNTHVDLRNWNDSWEQHSTAMLWVDLDKEIENLLNVILSTLHASQSPEETKKIIDLLSEKWKALEELQAKYLAGINERKHLEEVQNHYPNPKRDTHDVINEHKGFLQKLGFSPGNVGMNPGLPDQDVEHDANVSVYMYPKSSSISGSSCKKSLKKVLVLKMKLDLARGKGRS